MNDDRSILEALQRRDPEAFALLFEQYSDKIYRLAMGLLEDENEAEAVVQDTFLRLFERLDQFEGRSQLGTWLYRIAYNRSIDTLRRRRPLVRLDLDEDDDSLPVPVVLADWRHLPETVLSDAEVTAALDNAIRNLPEIYRSVFILREIEGLSTQATADIVGISLSSAKVRLHRARLQLRESLAGAFVTVG